MSEYKMDPLLKNIRKIYPISKNSSEQLKGIFKEKKFKKKAPLSFKNHISTKFYIVKSGILRSYITDDKGKEFIKFIYTKHSVVGAFSSLIRKKEKNVIIDCLTNCDLIEVDFAEFKNLTNSNQEILQLYNNLLELLFIKLENRFYELSSLNATQLYLKFKKDNPGIENLIPLYHIASYLNITPVQLSRIRKDLYKTK
ncbi:Crp/Fnr family transcriptional regulator [Flavobacteriaceae bacterium]|nr:Crp/Fnr family transcriptional regulator [Flavobacteriaceae bacterium]MDB2625279.1 Crp/Fnr family transcriptional regulator [Flavobacteriaceae bacterium]